jgi:uncharacterized protein YbaR (Trm112 family)
VFIELTEHLKCPGAHEEQHLILVPDRMVGRTVLGGTVACPVCRREYPVTDGIVRFGAPPPAPPWRAMDAGLAEAVRALLSLSNPGGYVVLVGSACVLASSLATLMGGVHFVGVNPPAGVDVTPSLSLLEHGAAVPLRSAMARGVVLGEESATSSWLEDGARVLLGGLRLVVLRAETEAPPGITRLASGQGLWVGEKGRAMRGDKGR